MLHCVIPSGLYPGRVCGTYRASGTVQIYYPPGGMLVSPLERTGGESKEPTGESAASSDSEKSILWIVNS